MSLIELDNIAKTYDSGVAAVKALRGVSLRFDEGEFVSIMGRAVQENRR